MFVHLSTLCTNTFVHSSKNLTFKRERENNLNMAEKTSEQKPFLVQNQNSAALPMEEWDKVSDQFKQLTTPTHEKEFYFVEDMTGIKYKINFGTGIDPRGQTFANIVKVTDDEMKTWLK